MLNFIKERKEREAIVADFLSRIESDEDFPLGPNVKILRGQEARAYVKSLNLKPTFSERITEFFTSLRPLRLGKSTKEKIITLATCHGMSASEFVNQAIDEYTTHHQKQTL
ncbi:hypothetical protein [Alloscardovia omnicolens]|uniref:hypothetical protein n=1 Tax=Alloscardovia omnicolens TaxID=419015 RepID=UPI003A6E4F58